MPFLLSSYEARINKPDILNNTKSTPAEPQLQVMRALLFQDLLIRFFKVRTIKTIPLLEHTTNNLEQV